MITFSTLQTMGIAVAVAVPCIALFLLFATVLLGDNSRKPAIRIVETFLIGIALVIALPIGIFVTLF